MSCNTYVFPFDESTKQFAKLAINESDENRDVFIEEVKAWMLDHPNLGFQSDDLLILAFLRGCKFNMERAKSKILSYYNLRLEVPEWFSNRNPALPDMQELVRLGVFVPLRKLHENRLVIIIRTAAHDPKKHSQDDVFKVGNMILDIAAKQREIVQIYGVTAIFDMTGISIHHATLLTPSIIKKAVHSWQNYHCRPKQLEFINAPLYINVVLNVFKSFMSEKLRNRVSVHFRGVRGLHKVVSPTVLPFEYGGDDGAFQEQVDYWADELVRHKDWFLHDEQFKAKKGHKH